MRVQRGLAVKIFSIKALDEYTVQVMLNDIQ